MREMLRTLITSIVCLAIPAVSTGSLHAGPFHAGSAVYGLWSADSGPSGFLESGEGEFSAAVSQRFSLQYENGRAYSIDTTASVIGGDSFLNFLKLSAFTEGLLVDGNAAAAVMWSDRIYLNGGSPLPSSIRLTFSVDGTLSGGSTYDVESQSYRGRYADFRAYGGNDIGTDVGGVFDISGGDVAFMYQDQDGSGRSGFSGNTFSFDVQLIDSDSNYYDFDVALRVQAINYFTIWGTAEADFSHSVSLVSVTEGETGRGLDKDFQMSFESGRSIHPSAVPEPSSVVLLAIGGVIGVLQVRRRSSGTSVR